MLRGITPEELANQSSEMIQRERMSPVRLHQICQSRVVTLNAVAVAVTPIAAGRLNPSTSMCR